MDRERDGRKEGEGKGGARFVSWVGVGYRLGVFWDLES